MANAERAIEALYEDSVIRDSLADPEAQTLLSWAENQIMRLAEQTDDEAAFETQTDQLRGLLKSVNRFVGERSQMDAETRAARLERLMQAGQALGAPPAAAAASLSEAFATGDDATTLQSLLGLLTPAADTTPTAAPAPVQAANAEGSIPTEPQPTSPGSHWQNRGSLKNVERQGFTRADHTTRQVGAAHVSQPADSQAQDAPPAANATPNANPTRQVTGPQVPQEPPTPDTDSLEDVTHQDVTPVYRATGQAAAQPATQTTDSQETTPGTGPSSPPSAPESTSEQEDAVKDAADMAQPTPKPSWLETLFGIRQPPPEEPAPDNTPDDTFTGDTPRDDETYDDWFK